MFMREILCLQMPQRIVPRDAVDFNYRLPAEIRFS